MVMNYTWISNFQVEGDAAVMTWICNGGKGALGNGVHDVEDFRSLRRDGLLIFIDAWFHQPVANQLANKRALVQEAFVGHFLCP